jgi:hypothetical protein
MNHINLIKSPSYFWEQKPTKASDQFRVFYVALPATELKPGTFLDDEMIGRKPDDRVERFWQGEWWAMCDIACIITDTAGQVVADQTSYDRCFATADEAMSECRKLEKDAWYWTSNI